MYRISAFRITIRAVAVSVVLVAFSHRAPAAVPALINYEGRLVQANQAPASGSHAMRFLLYSVPTGGSPVWQEPPAAVTTGRTVIVTNGVFDVLLGGYDPFNNPLPAAAFTGSTYLEVQVDGDTMGPRVQIVSAGYAFRAGTADAVADNAVGTSQIASGAVTPSKVSPAGAADAQVLGYRSTTGVGWMNDGLTLPYAKSVASDGPAFAVGNIGAGPAARFDGSVQALGDLFVDAKSQGTGTLHPGLLFGAPGTGEGIASNRDSTSVTRWSMDFYTNSTKRMTVANNGNVGVGLDVPKAKLDVAGTVQSTYNGTIGRLGTGGEGVYAYADASGTNAIFGLSTSTGMSGVVGKSTGGGYGVSGYTSSPLSSGTAGVWGVNDTGIGVFGTTTSGQGVHGEAAGGVGVFGYTLGAGRAGQFIVNNASNSVQAVDAISNGTGMAVKGYMTGTGIAGHFTNANTGNSSPALYATTSGTGYAGYMDGRLRVTSWTDTGALNVNSGSLMVSASGTTVTINSNGDVKITAPNSVSISAGTDLKLSASGNVNVSAGGSMTLSAGGATYVRGATVNLN